ncbi:NAD-dependent epimerase/dehydratase family protein [Phenylobacterium sp.]|uniref:NAD-dependent epimerase/dehydratase family protein n=1 Tax=Phenylobacterium sp. TaxID=1871053 RepID=UPI0035B1FD9C
MTRQVLVTGGTGFVAGWTIVELLRRGYAVRTTVRGEARAEAVRSAVGREADVSSLQFATADLTADAGWDAAVEGCAGVLHIASPMGQTAAAAELTEAARGGALRVLAASARQGVKRVVITSSTAACTPARPLKRAITEADWTDPDQPGLSGYRRSKTLAERAAWDFAAGQPQLGLTTILPGAIFGPVLTKAQLGSVGILQQLLSGQPRALPRLGFNITDVRDLAAAHVNALEAPGAVGRRFITMGEALWYGDVADTLRDRLGAGAAKVPTARMPDVVARTLGLVSPQMKALMPLLGRTQAFSSEAAAQVIGWSPRPARDTVADCGASLLA